MDPFPRSLEVFRAVPRRHLVGVVSLLCWQTSQRAKPKDEMMQLYGVFVDAVEQVEMNYVRKVDRRELLESALRGMLQNLDQHSAYFSDADWKQFKKQIEGSFSGIGVTVDIDPETNRLTVEAPLVGSPAYAAGVLFGVALVRYLRRNEPLERDVVALFAPFAGLSVALLGIALWPTAVASFWVLLAVSVGVLVALRGRWLGAP